jgi:hypothetical protein
MHDESGVMAKEHNITQASTSSLLSLLAAVKQLNGGHDSQWKTMMRMIKRMPTMTNCREK